MHTNNIKVGEETLGGVDVADMCLTLMIVMIS